MVELLFEIEMKFVIKKTYILNKSIPPTFYNNDSDQIADMMNDSLR